MQEQFIKYLKSKSQNHTSFVDEVADVLDIGYDAAYRRINLKTNLTLEEGVKLARFYKISLNKLFEVGESSTIITELSPPITNEQTLQLYFEQSLKNVYALTKLKNTEFIWSSKDIAFFHTLNDSYLTRYKMYVWLKDVNVDMAKSKIPFDDWMETIPQSLLQSAFELSAIYKDINITELWNDDTVNGTLQQIIYYYEAGLVSKDMALRICNDVHEVIKHTERQTIQQSLSGGKSEKYFKLFKCDLHRLTNALMVVTSFQKVFFVPFTVLSYLKIEHRETCEMMHEFLEKQMANSKLLATSGERDRTVFFNKIHNKIKIAEEIINLGDRMAIL